MKNPHVQNSGRMARYLLVAIGLLVALVSATALAKSRWRTTEIKASADAGGGGPARSELSGPEAVTQPAPQVVVSEQKQAELVRLTTKGFEPAEITRPTGKFLLGVTNRTGLPELSLRLTHESRRRVDGKELGREVGWRRVLDLPPGRYALREASHPDWICRITINAR